MSQLVRLIYVSRWAAGLEADIDETVRKIITTSVQNNRLADVTGMLFAQNGWFVQALEGPKSRVDATLTRIRNDSRHTDLKVIAAVPAEARAFRDWNMVAVELGPDVQAAQTRLGLTEPFNPTSLSGEEALALMLALAAAERERERKAITITAA